MSELRRGACPTLEQPMLAGDGLLARLIPTAPMSMPAWETLCDASARHGNGIMEVTQRGSVQIRGLSATSASAFAAQIAALDIAMASHPSILTSPLLGFDADEPIDLRVIVADLRGRLAHCPDIASLAPKVSVLLDGGGRLHLDDAAADVRLRAVTASRLEVSIGGTAATAASLGAVEPDLVVDVIVKILAILARHGTGARARNLLAGPGVSALRAELGDVFMDTPAPQARTPYQSIGLHPLPAGGLAYGCAPAFGHLHAHRMRRFVRAAARCNAVSIRPAPARTLLVIGAEEFAADEFVTAAEAEGFIVRSDDARRQVVACAGAPACGSALVSTRVLAPLVADAAPAFLDGSVTVHLSGCAKGCAHPAAASLTFVGPDRVIVNGCAHDRPQGILSNASLIAALRRLQSAKLSAPAGERSVAMLSGWDLSRLLDTLGAEPTRG